MSFFIPHTVSKGASIMLCLFVLITVQTCLSPIDVEPSDFEDFLVVQGFIDDDFGPHDLRITRVSKFTSVRDGGTVSIIEDAKVQIIDQDGQITPLERVTMQRKELIPPRPFLGPPPCIPVLTFVEIKTDYRTPETFRGEIGNTYTLEITTKEGEAYRSEPQTMRATPPIDSLTLLFKRLPGLDPTIIGSGVEVFASWKDPVEEENFYFWRVNGIYKIFTPDLSNGSGRCCPYDPRDGGAMICWIVEKNMEGNLLAFSDQRVNGQKVTLPVGLIEDDGVRFAGTSLASPEKQYYIEIEQYMIPEEAFEFSQRAKILGTINGEIFDPPPLNIRGNIFNVNDPEETAIGYFGAYSAQKKGKFINRNILEFTQRSLNPCGDCRVRPGAQIETPEPFR